jgi:protein tyrosine/serine phosphatase
VNLHNIAIQFAFLYAPLVHSQVEQVTPNLSRGPDPKIADIYRLRDQGVKTIISLRTNSELKKQKLCKELGLNWYQIKTGVFKTPSDDQFDRFRAIVNDSKNCPCYASCEIDMDRTGVYIAAYRMVDQHWTREQMVAELRTHHQKRWWPIFRKYEAKVVAYAQKHQPTKDTDKAG